MQRGNQTIYLCRMLVFLLLCYRTLEVHWQALYFSGNPKIKNFLILISNFKNKKRNDGNKIFKIFRNVNVIDKTGTGNNLQK